VKNDVLFGIITATDIVRYIGTGRVFEKLVTGNVTEVMNIPVRDLISGNLYTTGPDATVTDAAREMMAKKVGALPVIDQSRLAGLVTEFDLVKAFALANNGR
jgi:CBS domain-containing protein